MGCRVALGFLAALSEGAGPFGELRERAEVWVVPVLNPDGYARTVARDGAGKLAELRTNARGVDLNRNFPLPPGRKRPRIPGTGTSRAGRSTFRGAAPLSEPETAALDALFADPGFASIDLENGGLAFNPVTGELWGVESNFSQTRSVFRVDPGTGLAVGPVGAAGVEWAAHPFRLRQP